MSTHPRTDREVFRAADREVENAAVVALLAAMATGSQEPSVTQPGPPSFWSDPEFASRRPLTPGPRAWWASGLAR